MPIAALPPAYVRPKPKPSPKPSAAPRRSSPNPDKPPKEGSEKGAAEIGASSVPAPASPLSDRLRADRRAALPGPDLLRRPPRPTTSGPPGPSILAAINEIESGFGQNLGPSSAGAVGWMQFMPSTWATYGVDADADGDKDPNEPHDAIFAAARYLRAAGMPEDPEGAVFAYNHADWYVAEVMARAACFSGIGNGAIGGLSLIPKRQELVCAPADGRPRSRSPTTT